MRIRQALPHDATAIAELSRQLAAHVQDPDPGLDTDLLASCGFGPDRWFECLVAEKEGRLVGFALFCRRFEAHTREKRLWLGDLCIARDQRRRGIGRALIAAVQARAAELGCVGIDLELARGNQEAKAFYASLEGTVYDQVQLWRLAP